MSGAEGEEEASRLDGDGVYVVDLRGEACVLLRTQWSPHVKRDPKALKGIVLHQWASKVGTEGRLRLKFGSEAEALGQRCNRVTYGISAGVGERDGVPVVSLAHPPERYTYASDDACSEYISLGVMGLFPFEEETRTDKHTIVTRELMAAVNRGIEEALAQMEGEGPWALITHRQGINGRHDHVQCPGEAVVRMALLSDAVLDGRLVPDPDLVLMPKWGRPWPDSWRQHLGASVVRGDEDDCDPRQVDLLDSLLQGSDGDRRAPSLPVNPRG